ncbi:SIS domain-containing protein [Micrococcales bacterium 31B]|nr:SIS domain-containing protein [Micrococcales bacterium 31B]
MTDNLFVTAELTSQPDVWRQAATTASENATLLPQPGQRIAVVGCGTSWFIAQAYAVLREEAGEGVTDAFAGSEYPLSRDYDLIVAITRSGTTTEILDLVTAVKGRVKTLVITGDPTKPGMTVGDAAIVMPYADEQSVVQTRFATAALTLLRAGLGHDIEALATACERALAEDLPADILTKTQFTFLGRGYSVGLANEAALKMREASIAWAESYPGMDYRHGPISITDENSAVILLGDAPEGLVGEIAAVGGTAYQWNEDGQVTLVRCHRLAVANALKKGLNPDTPRNLTRSIILK